MPDYDADAYGWANKQAALLRAGRLTDADIAEDPSVDARPGESLDTALWARRALAAAGERTGPTYFPGAIPYPLAQSLDEGFYPE